MWVKQLVVWMICMVVLEWMFVGFLYFESCAYHRYWTLFVESFNVRCMKIRLQMFMTNNCAVGEKRYTRGSLWEVHNMKISRYIQSAVTKLLILIPKPTTCGSGESPTCRKRLIFVCFNWLVDKPIMCSKGSSLRKAFVDRISVLLFDYLRSLSYSKSFPLVRSGGSYGTADWLFENLLSSISVQLVQSGGSTIPSKACIIIL